MSSRLAWLILTVSAFLAPLKLGADAPLYDSKLDLEYANVNGHSLKLDLFLPKGAAKPIPLVIFIHGGGWMGGGKHDFFPPSLPLVQAGIAIANLDYRFSNEAVFPAQLHDCKAAVRWLRAHAVEYGLNPDKFGAMGNSAGGHLVALLGTTADHPELEGDEGNPGVSSTVQAVADFYGPANLVTFDPHAANDAALRLIGGPPDQYAAKAKVASPLFYVTPQACPFLIIHGDKDNLVPLSQSVEFNDALKKAGVDSSLFIVPGGGHGFPNPEPYAATVAFFQKHLIRP
jgi:acetyl esterase/lipase